MDQAMNAGTQYQDASKPAEAQAVASEAVPEKVLKQSEVNELIGRIKQETYARGMKEGLAQAAQVGQPQQPTPVPQSMGGMQQLTEEQVRQLIADEHNKQAQLAQANNVLASFAQQMGAGKGKYSDFDETVAKLGDLRHLSHIVQYATEQGNAEDIMYELGRNPTKVASLTTLAYINPELAKYEMRRLSESIKQNESAKNIPIPNDPLSQMKPSTAGTDSGKADSVSDWRRKPWLRA